MMSKTKEPIFVHIPKTGGTAIRNTLKYIEQFIAKGHSLSIHIPRNIFKFAIII